MIRYYLTIEWGIDANGMPVCEYVIYQLNELHNFRKFKSFVDIYSAIQFLETCNGIFTAKDQR